MSTTPRDALEHEVIRARKAKFVEYVDQDEKMHMVAIKAIAADDLRDAAEIFSALFIQVLKLGSNMQNIGTRISEITKKAKESVDDKDKLSSLSDEISNVIGEMVNVDAIKSFLMQTEGTVKTLIEIGTDVAYEDIKSDFLVVGEFILKIIDHNTGPELMNFLARGLRKIFLLMRLQSEKSEERKVAIQNEPSN
jgi:hypothetical protein